MLKIGEFARLCQVSVKTLRHYDACGLLQPSHTDPATGYRRYDLAQLSDMVRILALKDCGFTLPEIGRLLCASDPGAIEVLLAERVAAQERAVAEEQARLLRLRGRLALLTSASQVTYDVVLKCTEPLTLVGVRECLASRDQIGPLAEAALERIGDLALAAIGPMVHVYHAVDADRIDLFVGATVMALPAAHADLACERLAGGGLVACVLHRGDYATIGQAYVALHRWLATSGYAPAGPCREIYHRGPRDTAERAALLTEIQLPIQAAGA